MKQPNQHPCLIAHAIVIVHALYIFTVSIFSFTDWFNKCQSGELENVDLWLWTYLWKKIKQQKSLAHVCFIAVWIRFEINVLNWCSRDWGFEGLIESLAQYARAELLFYQFSHLLQGIIAQIRNTRGGAPLLSYHLRESHCVQQTLVQHIKNLWSVQSKQEN